MQLTSSTACSGKPTWQPAYKARNMKPRVTIGICAKDAAKILHSTLESIDDQDFDHSLIEIVFVDDGSKDDTLKIIKDYASKADINTRIFSGPWRGVGKARNTVVQNAFGDYIIWIDSDETIEKSFVKKQVGLMDQNPQAGIAVNKLTIDWEKTWVLSLDELPHVAEYRFRDWTNPLKMPGTGGTTYRTEALRQVEGFNTDLHGACEDIEVANRVRKAGWNIVRANAQYHENHGGLASLKVLWNRNYKRGIDSRHFQNKTNTLFSLYRMNPLSSFAVSFRYALLGYIETKHKLAFILPLHFTFKMTAWYCGFMKH